MRKKIALFLVLFCFIGVFLCFPQRSSDRCDDRPPPGPPPDKADDNYSFNLEGSQSTTIPTYFELYPFIGIFKNGNVVAMDNLLEKFGRGCLYVEKGVSPEVTLRHIKTLVIPTGGFFDLEKSAYLKLLLEQFVAQVGIIICFSQQEIEDFDLLPRPMGEALKAYGWGSDQSCLKSSVYFDSIHPVLSTYGQMDYIKKICYFVSIILFLIIGNNFHIFAQSGLQMSVSGYVRDVNSNNPISNVTVILFKMRNGKIVKSFSESSDKTGFYKIRFLEAGIYKLALEIPEIGSIHIHSITNTGLTTSKKELLRLWQEHKDTIDSDMDATETQAYSAGNTCENECWDKHGEK